MRKALNINMKHNFLNTIEGLSNENLITESLAYMLSHPEFSIYQKLFYSHLFSISEHKDTEEWEFEILTQDYNPEHGIPDLVIQNSNSIIILENKFWADFSQKNQYWRYTQILLEKNDFEKKYLVLLCLQNKLGYFKLKIYEQFKLKGIKISNESELTKYLNNSGIEPIFLIWEDIINLFMSKNLLSESIEQFINTRFINLITIQKEELTLLNSKTIPNLLNIIWNTVDQIKGILNNEKFKIGRTGQSRLFYGYTIYYDWGNLWFGQYIDSWRTYDTPFVIQLRENWISEEHIRKKAPEYLRSIGFIENSDLGFLFPFNIENSSTNLAEDIALKLIETLRILEKVNFENSPSA